MARKRAANGRRKKNQPAELVFEEGYWWIVQGTKRLNAGRNERYARQLMKETSESA